MAKRSINGLDIIRQYAEECGMSIQDLLADTGVSVQSLESLSDSDQWVTERQELQALQNVLNTRGDPFIIGWQLGQRYQLTSYGIWGYALLSSASLRKAMDLGLRYLGLTYALCHIELIERNGKVELIFTPKAQGDLGTLVLVRDISALLVIQRELFAGGFPVFEIHLTLSEQELPSVVTDLTQGLGFELVLNSDQSAVIFDANLLDRPLPRANAQTAKTCEDQCRQLLQQQNQYRDIAQDVRDKLLSLGLYASMEQVASSMARTTRTLHRQLKEEGMSWRLVRDEVRMGMAEALLANSISFDEIAERLGYSDAANFSHAFKRWKGVSPKTYRDGLYMAT
ncbi:AraC family transcriptional regulator [Bermanella marisrubri]|nr:AraC family transcriptional regulator [Bermanella marisrubri]